jgi:hypothetical protein
MAIIFPVPQKGNIMSNLSSNNLHHEVSLHALGFSKCICPAVAASLLSGLHCDDPSPLPKVHLNVILDGTWTEYEATRVLA